MVAALLLWWMGFNMSVAVAVGFIALPRRGGKETGCAGRDVIYPDRAGV